MELAINIVASSLREAESYGVIANHLAQYLAEKGVTVHSFGFDEALTVTLPPSDGVFYSGPPSLFAPVGKGPHINITMFETSICPDVWIPQLNKMDAVIVPSQLCYTAFRESGVTAPLHRIPLGVGEVYHPVHRNKHKTMRFLAFFDRGIRKGGLDAVKAFQMAFGDDPRYQLVLKTRGIAPQVILFDNPNISLIQKDMSAQELYELYCSCDVLIAPTRGEGWGLLPREFAATGGIALATNWGGTADNIGQWGISIPHAIGKADYATGMPELAGQALGEWAIPNVEALTDLLKDVVDNREFYNQFGLRAAENVRKLYSWSRFSEQAYAVWRGLV